MTSVKAGAVCISGDDHPPGRRTEAAMRNSIANILQSGAGIIFTVKVVSRFYCVIFPLNKRRRALFTRLLRSSNDFLGVTPRIILPKRHGQVEK
jgi:hypothetical protein